MPTRWLWRLRFAGLPSACISTGARTLRVGGWMQGLSGSKAGRWVDGGLGGSKGERLLIGKWGVLNMGNQCWMNGWTMDACCNAEWLKW